MFYLSPPESIITVFFTVPEFVTPGTVSTSIFCSLMILSTIISAFFHLRFMFQNLNIYDALVLNRYLCPGRNRKVLKIKNKNMKK